MRKLTACLLIAASSFLSSCDARGSAALSADEFGPEWPLTVASAELRCERGSAVVLTHAGADYGVNGSALALGYPRLDPIWRRNADSAGGPRVSVRPLISRGMELCSR